MIEEIYISNHIYLLYFYIFLVLTSLSVIDNVIQESDHSYSISVSLWDVSAYNDNSCLINYAAINSLIKKQYWDISIILETFCDDISQQFWSVERERAASQHLQLLMQTLQNKLSLRKNHLKSRKVLFWKKTNKNTWEEKYHNI